MIATKEKSQRLIRNRINRRSLAFISEEMSDAPHDPPNVADTYGHSSRSLWWIEVVPVMVMRD
jgi:hypothetical protein